MAANRKTAKEPLLSNFAADYVEARKVPVEKQENGEQRWLPGLARRPKETSIPRSSNSTPASISSLPKRRQRQMTLKRRGRRPNGWAIRRSTWK